MYVRARVCVFVLLCLVFFNAFWMSAVVLFPRLRRAPRYGWNSAHFPHQFRNYTNVTPHGPPLLAVAVIPLAKTTQYSLKTFFQFKCHKKSPTCPRNSTPAKARKSAAVSSSPTPISRRAAVVISYLRSGKRTEDGRRAREGERTNERSKTRQRERDVDARARC